MDMFVTAIPALLAAAFVWKLSQLYPSGGGNHPGVGGQLRRATGRRHLKVRRGRSGAAAKEIADWWPVRRETSQKRDGSGSRP